MSISALLAWLTLVATPAGFCVERAPMQLGAGVHVGLGWHPMQGAKDALVDHGLTFRDEVLWDHIETTRGVLKFPARLKDLDDLVTSASKAGLRPLLILDYGNKLYGDGLPETADQIAAYVRYVRFVVRYFAGRVDQFEVWNEWNFGMGSPVRPRPPGGAEAYVSLLKATWSAIKAENPQATVVGGALALVDLQWLDAFGRAGGFQYVDAFSVHPYEFWWDSRRPGPPLGVRLSLGSGASSRQGAQSVSESPATAWQPIPGTPEAAIAKLDLLQVHVKSYVADRELPIYVTEISWPTNTSRFGSSEATAAAYLQRFVLLAASRTWVAAVFWHDLYDDGDDSTKVEFRYGLRRKTGPGKPAYDALLAVRCLVQSPIRPGATNSMDERIEIAGADCNERQFVATWLPSDEFERTIEWAGGAALLNSGFSVLTARPARPTVVGASPTIYVHAK